MKHVLVLLALFASLEAFAQQQDEFPVGVFTSGGNDLNFTELRDSLNIRWITGYIGSYAWPPTPLLTNQESLKVIGIREGIYPATQSQRMWYEAEKEAPQQESDWNYFGTRETGTDLGNAWVCDPSLGHQPGIMVRHPRPNRRSYEGTGLFYYGQTSYYATFNMKITKVSGHPEDTVAILKVISYDTTGSVYECDSLVLLDSSFVADNSYQQFEVHFNIFPISATTLDTLRFLSGNMQLRSTQATVDSVDILVEWRGHRTTWLDYVIVDDKTARQLFAGELDETIRDEVAPFRTQFPNMQRFYLNDEPWVPAFLPYKYVDRLIMAESLNIGSPRGRGTTANGWGAEYLDLSLFKSPSRRECHHESF